jgi:integral membrane protein
VGEDGRVTTLKTLDRPRAATPRSLYRALALAEMATWTLLILGMVLKYAVALGDWPVQVTGMVHGIVFVSYAVTAALVGVNQRWPLARIAAAVATAVVPYATYPFDRWLERRGHLEGAWRREPTDDPRDRAFPSRALRVLLAHPVALGVGMAAAVALIVTALLVVGPPTEWGR